MHVCMHTYIAYIHARRHTYIACIQVVSGWAFISQTPDPFLMLISVVMQVGFQCTTAFQIRHVDPNDRSGQKPQDMHCSLEAAGLLGGFELSDSKQALIAPLHQRLEL